jgi:hypothetical protein
MPEILVSEISSGAPASSEAANGIRATLGAMAACEGDWQALMDFYSDDYLRRARIGSESGQGAYYAAAGLVLDANRRPVTSFNEASELPPDGRVGVLFLTGNNVGAYVIFAEQDGYWLIDERYVVVPRLNMAG